MPTSKKPRKAYAHRKALRRSAFANACEAQIVFDPLFRFFDQLRTGILDDVQGKPIMADWQGGVVEVAPALLGWADCWERIADAEGLVINLSPLRRISQKLFAVSPLTEGEVEAGEQALLATHRAFMRLPAGVIKYHANNEEISIALERV